MAGIGFELRKLLNKKSILIHAGGYFYATFVSVGPLLIVVLFLIAIRMILRSMGIPLLDQNVVLATITYAFMSSLLFSGIFSMVYSRYISDMIYMQQEEKVFPSFVTAVSMGILLSGVASGAFLIFWAKLPVFYEIICYILCLSITTTFTTMVYVSAVKNYKKITYSFIIGCGVGLAVEWILRRLFSVNVVYSILLGFIVTFLLIAILLIMNVYSFFKKHDNSYFDVLGYIRRMPRLVLINSFYYISIFIHNIIIWNSYLGMRVADTFIVAPIYDVPAFIALLTAMPAMVIFVIKTETTFYDHYKEYMSMLAGGGTLSDLKYAGDTMKDHMYNEVVAMLHIQLMISALCVVLSRALLPLIGFSDFEINVFGYMTLAYFCIMGVHIISSILLYFDDRRSALQIIATFLGLHIVFVIISVQMGQNFIGLGSTVAGVLSVLFAFVKLRVMANSLDYRLYCSQPIFTQK